jgi:CcmD family protein
MGPWGFVFMAYGIVWVALLLYLFLLKRRLRDVEKERAAHRPAEKSHTSA